MLLAALLLLTLPAAILTLRPSAKLRTPILTLWSCSLSLLLSDLYLRLRPSLPPAISAALLTLLSLLPIGSALAASVSATASLSKEIGSGSNNGD